MSNARLAARVKAQNRVNTAVNHVVPQLIEIFSDYVGRKVVKSGGSLLKKISDAIEGIDFGDPEIRVFHESHFNTMVVFQFKVSEQVVGGSGCVYATETVTIGTKTYNSNELEKVSEFHERKTDYTVEGVIENRERYKELQRQANAAKDALRPFGEYDN